MSEKMTPEGLVIGLIPDEKPSKEKETEPKRAPHPQPDSKK